MKMEIERKFLVTGDSWRKQAARGLVCEQGYLSASGDGATVRVRRMDGKGFLTVKGPTEGISRVEMEYQIPESDAEVMLEQFCGGRIVAKTRYQVEFEGLIWEIDEFSGVNAGLILAEVELDEENQSFEKPEWLGREVSHDPRYFNAALAQMPFCSWQF